MSGFWWCGRCGERLTFNGCGCVKAATSPWWWVPTGLTRVRCWLGMCKHRFCCIHCASWALVRTKYKEWKRDRDE